MWTRAELKDRAKNDLRPYYWYGVLVCFIAGILGLTAAVGVLSVVDSVYYQAVTVAQEGFEVSWQISFGTGMLALFILIAGSLLAGVIPAYRALSIKAVDAIREE